MDANRCRVINSLITCGTIVVLFYKVNEAETRNGRASRVREIYNSGDWRLHPRAAGQRTADDLPGRRRARAGFHKPLYLRDKLVYPWRLRLVGTQATDRLQMNQTAS